MQDSIATAAEVDKSQILSNFINIPAHLEMQNPTFRDVQRPAGKRSVIWGLRSRDDLIFQ
jgi:hypothetical protein